MVAIATASDGGGSIPDSGLFRFGGAETDKRADTGGARSISRLARRIDQLRIDEDGKGYSDDARCSADNPGGGAVSKRLCFQAAISRNSNRENIASSGLPIPRITGEICRQCGREAAVLQTVTSIGRVGVRSGRKKLDIDGILLMEAYYAMNGAETNAMLRGFAAKLGRPLTADDMELVSGLSINTAKQSPVATTPWHWAYGTRLRPRWISFMKAMNCCCSRLQQQVLPTLIMLSKARN